ncbi:MAG: transposase [Gammaproteobacteria bacterium]|nr:transposase [Gammaproteobacteria bacterium]
MAGRRPIFRHPENATMMVNALRWINDAKRFFVDAAVVMPDHLHLAGRLGEGSLASVMHTLKSFTANQLVGNGVMSPVWQDGYHDHQLRDDEDYGVHVRYLIENPTRAGLVEHLDDYPYLIFPDWWCDQVAPGRRSHK